VVRNTFISEDEGYEYIGELRKTWTKKNLKGSYSLWMLSSFRDRAECDYQGVGREFFWGQA
jgi:hypothetical protein